MAYRAAKKDLDRAHLIICEKPLKASVDSKKQQNPKSGSFANAESFEKDYPTFLLSLASSLRTGLDPLAALLEVRKLFDTKSVIRAELEKFRGLIEGGMDETEALRNFGSSINHPDIVLFKTAYMLSRKQGSSLSETLHRLAKVTRHRQSFRRKVRSAVAMQKLSAFGIGGCAVLICLIQAVGNPKIVSDALSNPVGVKLLGLGAILIVSGLFWMLRMTRSKI